MSDETIIQLATLVFWLALVFWLGLTWIFFGRSRSE